MNLVREKLGREKSGDFLALRSPGKDFLAKEPDPSLLYQAK